MIGKTQQRHRSAEQRRKSRGSWICSTCCSSSAVCMYGAAPECVCYSTHTLSSLSVCAEDTKMAYTSSIGSSKKVCEIDYMYISESDLYLEWLSIWVVLFVCLSMYQYLYIYLYYSLFTISFSLLFLSLQNKHSSNRSGIMCKCVATQIPTQSTAANSFLTQTLRIVLSWIICLHFHYSSHSSSHNGERPHMATQMKALRLSCASGEQRICIACWFCTRSSLWSSSARMFLRCRCCSFLNNKDRSHAQADSRMCAQTNLPDSRRLSFVHTLPQIERIPHIVWGYSSPPRERDLEWRRKEQRWCTDAKRKSEEEMLYTSHRRCQ